MQFSELLKKIFAGNDFDSSVLHEPSFSSKEPPISKPLRYDETQSKHPGDGISDYQGTNKN